MSFYTILFAVMLIVLQSALNLPYAFFYLFTFGYEGKDLPIGKYWICGWVGGLGWVGCGCVSLY